MSIKRLKLDKFVSGTEQRVFKTTTIKEKESDESLNITQKDVFYGEYSISKLRDSKVDNHICLSGDLINFHDIHSDYITNRPDNKKVLSLNGSASPWFPNDALNAQLKEEHNNTERITYFPSYVDTPIDIAYSRNNNYMLLPLNTERYTNIVQNDNMLKYRNYPISAENKPNYTNLFNNEISRPVNYAEDNSVPIYDLNFTFLQSINLENYDNIINFITKHNLSNLSGQIRIFNDKTFRENDNTANSIYLPSLITMLTKYNYQIGDDNKKLIIQDLISQLDIYSSIRFLSPIGQITKLNDDVITGYNTHILSSDFTKENIYDINNCFTEKQIYMITPHILPQNVVINGDVRYSLQVNQNINNNKFYDKQYIPSTYFNIAYMKNNRNPHYNINYQINEENIPLYDYKINMERNQINVESILSGDNNEKYNNLFDIDITHACNINGNFGCSFKNLTNTILEESSKKDLELANEYPSTYGNMYPKRMISKIDDYLEPYKNYHVAHNKLYNIGQLNGIRNYIHVGTLQDSDKLWFSYKYKTTTDQYFIDTFSETYNMEFEPIELNRESKHWIYDIYGKQIIDNVMKYSKQICPWSTNVEKYQTQVDITYIQELLGCTCEKNDTCNGFCTFPANKGLNIPSGIVWTKNNNSIYIIPSSKNDRNLFVEENIQVNDDIEIYFINDKNQIKEIETSDRSISTISSTYFAIFQGFGNYIQNPEQPIPSYLAINNTDENQQISGYTIPSSCPFNYAHTIPAGTKLIGLNWETKQLVDTLPAGYIAVFRVRSWWSDIVQCKGKIKSQVLNLNIDDMLQIVSNYDYVERNFGFFKYQQENLHKSNIYSIKITNSGLNPETDKITETINLSKLVEMLIDKFKVNLLEEIISVENFEAENPLYDLYFDYNTYTFNAVLLDPNLLLSTDSNPLYIISDELPEANETNLNKIYKINNTELYYRCIKHKNNYEWFEFNFKDFPSDPLPKLFTISLDELAALIDYRVIYDEENKFKYAYNINTFNENNNFNKVKAEIREYLETAIRNSVSKYMPVETTLWKIIYIGK